MTSPIRRSPPRPNLSADIDSIGRDSPATYRVLNAMYTAIKAQGAQQGVLNAGSDIRPIGPRSVVASQLGGTIQLAIANETSHSRVTLYQIWRASAGSVLAPTTPTFDQAVRYSLIIAQRVTNAPSTSMTTWADRDFTIPELDVADLARFSYWVSSIDDSFQESIGISATNTPIEILPAGPGDQSPEVVYAPFTRLWNGALDSTDTGAGTSLESVKTVTGATNAANIVVTSASHGYANGDRIAMFCVKGNTAANGIWTAAAVAANTFELAGSVGNGAFAGGAYCIRISTTGQPEPPVTLVGVDGAPLGLGVADGGGAITPTIVGSAAAAKVQSGKIAFGAPAAGQTSIARFLVSMQCFDQSNPATFSFYMMGPDSAFGGSQAELAKYTITVTINGVYNDGSTIVTPSVATFSGPVLPMTFFGIITNPQVRFVFEFSNSNVNSFGYYYIDVSWSAGGTVVAPQNAYLFCPMVNLGQNAGFYTAQFEDSIVGGMVASSFVTSSFGRSVLSYYARDPAGYYQ